MTDRARPLTLFISYSHKDDVLREKLEAHLALLKRRGLFDVWHDRKIGAGREWIGKINDALERADVVLLLVSADFLASDYCQDKELTRAMERHAQGTARVVPVILRACDWEGSAFGKLQALPRDGKPIDGHPDGMDSALKQVAVALREIANELCGLPQPVGTPKLASDTRTLTDALCSAVEPQSAESDTIAPSTSPHEATDHRFMPPQQKLKIGSIKLGALELGPFEVNWPPSAGVIRFVMVGGVLTCAAMLGLYWLMVKPVTDGSRDLMRLGDYVGAVRKLEGLQPNLQWLPPVANALAQARFGAKLVTGEPIRSLAPELEQLSKRSPNMPDVLVFQGLSDYWVDANIEGAIEHFTQATQRDPKHVEAHFLAAARHLDRAYSALERREEDQARQDIAAARQLMDNALTASPFAEKLPRYANQRAELAELEGDFKGAYAVYERLATTHSLSAMQSALASWRLSEPGVAIRHGLEASQAALIRLDKDTNEAGDTVGWSFRIDGTQVVTVNGKFDKACLVDWVVQISQALLAAGEADGEKNATAIAPGKTPGAPEHCSHEVATGPIRDVVCVQALTAQTALAASDSRAKVLEEWRKTRLHCGPELKPLPLMKRNLL